jgi:hypothetical protein
MTNVKFISIDERDGTTTEHAIIDRGNEEFTSMLKSDYDTLGSELPDAATKKAK